MGNQLVIIATEQMSEEGRQKKWQDQEGLTRQRSFKSFKQSPLEEKGHIRIYAGLLLNTGILMEICSQKMTPALRSP